MPQSSMLQKFLEHIEAKNPAKHTVLSLETILNHAQKTIGNHLEDVDWEDLLTYIKGLKNNFSDGSIYLYESKLIQFYNFCFDETDNDKYIKFAKKIKKLHTGKSKTRVKPQDLLTPEDVKKLINVATLERDRCIVAILFESGIRIGELCSLKNSMVLMDEQKQEVTFNIPDIEGCKTGSRTIVCLEIYGYVQDWLKCNTDEDNFIDICQNGVRRTAERLFKKAGIKKPCNVHMFRHSAITHWVNIGMQHSAISMRAWGIPNSAMLATYIHLSEQMQAVAYRNAKGMNGDSSKIINPLACRCVNCGRLIQSGELCITCKENADLKQKYQELEAKMLGIMRALDNGNVIPAGSFKAVIEKKKEG